MFFGSPLQLCTTRLTVAQPGLLRSRCRLLRSHTMIRMSSTHHGRGYLHAMTLLESLQSNRTVVGSISSSARDMNLEAIPEMINWTRKAGYEVEDLHRHGLKCIHVAGTKGKGSVCVMTENILLQYKRKDGDKKAARNRGLGKIGLYTSPHLIDVRERIRIDGIPISEKLFTQYFFELWDRFAEAEGQKDDRLSAVGKPGFFRFLTILAFHTFIQQGVETAIIECGIGGEYDSTNIMPTEAVTVTAITKLGIDHVGMLGDTIEKIAWHKSGIMKRGVPAYTVPQVAEAEDILQKRATEKGVKLTVVERMRPIENGDVELGLGGDFQVDNASLAVAVAASHLRTLGITETLPDISQGTAEALPNEFVQGLKTVLWPARCQIINDGNIEWYIDGAHTTDSIIAAADWFKGNCFAAMQSTKSPKRMLIFNQQDRDAVVLLKTLMDRLRNLPIRHASMEKEAEGGQSKESPPANIAQFSARIFTYAAFCTNEPFPDLSKEAQPQDLSLQNSVARAYTSSDRNGLTMTYQSIQEAVDLAHKVAEGNEKFMVLVTGSLHLAGGLLKVLERRRHEQAQGCELQAESSPEKSQESF